MTVEIEILNSPASATAKINFSSGDSFTSEGGAMIAKSSGLQVETSTHKRSGGGLLNTFKRLLVGESLFLNRYTAFSGGQELYLASPLPGDMMAIRLNSFGLIVQGGSFVGHGTGVQMDVDWKGFKNILSGESFFWMQLKGDGEALLNSFGAIYCVEVEEEYIVDTGHIVAFEGSLDFHISKASKSWLHTFLSSEGFVCKFTGRGRIWCQGHSADQFGRALSAKLKPRVEG